MYRTEQNISQEALALKAGISPSHMGRLERGERGATIHSLEKVTEALNISIEELFRFLSPEFENKDASVMFDLVCKLSKRSIKDQKIILDLLDILPPWEDK
ncbi:MAG: helix-turn-helix transcriptional regulator [Clostridiaceae bacterium]|nr:helix-turn-helix transcriptional regulator [Clostridiaceae bacterium]